MPTRERLHFCPMSRTVTVRLTDDLVDWLEEAASQSGVSQGKLVREQIEKARVRAGTRGFMRLAGVTGGPRNLSRRKGFSRS